MPAKSETISIKLDYVINESISIDFLAAVMDYDWAMNAYAETEAGEQRVIMEESNTTIDAKINFGNSSSVVDGFVGLAYFEREQDFNSSGSTVYNGDDSSDSNALYGEISYTFSDVWSIIAGGRIERETQQRDFDMHICQCRSCEKGLELERLSYIREGFKAAREIVTTPEKMGAHSRMAYKCPTVEDYRREKGEA